MRISVEHVRHSLRTLNRHRRFSALAILSLALAIALNTTMYSVLDALIYPKVAMRHPEQLYRLNFMGDWHGRLTTAEKYDAITRLHFLEGITTVVPPYGTEVVEYKNKAVDARVSAVGPNFFALAGIVPSAGRLLSQADVNAEPRPVVVSERLWRQLFPDRPFGDSATIVLGNEPRLVVGTLPYEADFPGQYTDVWQLPTAKTRLYGGLHFLFVRARDGVSRAEADAELQQLAISLAARANESIRDVAFRLNPALGEPFRLLGFHLALIGAVIAVLLVACVNLANLQLARGIARSRELATRAAIGASRADIIVQLVLESAWLAIAGLALGLFLTLWAMKIVAASVPPTLSDYIVRPQASWRLFIAATLVTVVCLGLVGLLPAIRISRVDIHELIKSGAGTGKSRKSRRQYGALVVIQISLALALLVGAALLLRAVARLYAPTPSQLDRLLFGHIRIEALANSAQRADGKRNDTRALTDLSASVLARVRALPDVEIAATAIWRTPGSKAVSLDDPGGQPRVMNTGFFAYHVVSSEYPRLIGMKVYKGRDFQEGEFAQPVVIVDDRTARFLWPGVEPVGKLIKLARDSSRAPWLTVVGVGRYVNIWASPFKRVDQQWEDQTPGMGEILVLNGSDTSTVGNGAGFQLLIRTRHVADVQKMPNIARGAITDRSAGIFPLTMTPWRTTLRLDVMRERQTFVTALFVTFALLGLGVAALGVYAIVSHTVSQRTREFGVRVALGASSADIRRTVLEEGNVLALLGVAVGLVLAARTVQLLAAFRAADDFFDVVLFALVSAILFGVAWSAAYIPARRAMRINPVEALKND